jgi:signal transduction histidine kinase/HAMP domain-containing protein
MMAFAAILAAGIGLWKAAELREREYAYTLERADNIALEQASARVISTLETALTIADHEFFVERAREVVESEPGVDGIEVAWANGTSTSIGRGPTPEDQRIQGVLVTSKISPSAILLGSGTIRSADREHTKAANIAIYGRHPSLLGEVNPLPPNFYSHDLPWWALAVLLVLGAAYVMERRLSRLSAAIVHVVSGDYVAPIRIRGRDEVSWMSGQLSDLRNILEEQFERVKDKNESLQKNLAARNALLQKSAAFSSALVSPLDSSAGLRASAHALAEAGDAEMVLVFRHVSDRGVDECVASVGFGEQSEPAPLVSDDAIARELRQNDGVQRLSALKPNHTWMRTGGRNIPLYGHLGVTLQYRDKHQGYLILARNQPFDPASEELISSAARQLSIAVANYTAYEQAHSLTQVLRQKNHQLIEQRDALETANRLQSQFTATISHELRTPLNAIVGYGELLSDEVYGPIQPPQREALAGMMQAGSHLLAMVNQVLELSVADAGQLSIQLRAVTLDDLVREAILVVNPLCRNRPYTITAELFPATVQTDPERVHQVLVNLLNNAIKFTDAGSVNVVMSRSAPDSISLTVTDTGRGIAPEEQELIFEAFRQAEQGYDRSHDGVGLGLAISQQIAQALGGDIKLVSEPGVGSAFTLMLPTSAESTTPAAAPQDPQAAQ